MLQKNVLVPNLVKLKSAVNKLMRYFDDGNYKSGTIEVFIGNIPESDVAEALSLLKKSFPNFVIIGMSSVQYASFFKMESCIVMNFTAMENSRAELFYKPLEREGKNVAQEAIKFAGELRKRIAGMKDVRCIEIYFACIRASSSEFINVLSEELEEVPIFGSIASANSLKYLDGFVTVGHEDAFVIADENFTPGITGAIYCGEELYVYEDYLFGWEPIGRYMDVCACESEKQGVTTLWSIDGQKAIDVYRKYLGVEPNEHFVQNISEFPLIVERNGTYIGRTPSNYGPSGEVYLEGDIHPDEKVRFSYGEHEDILIGTKNAALRMDAFGAERLTLVICGNRFNFLQDDYKLEIQYYNEGRLENPNIVLGMGEIYRYRGQGGVLNSALVAVGMREGLSGETQAQVLRTNEHHHHEGKVPLSERLSHFLKAMTGELVEAVKEANAANEAKSSFLSNMSHEIRTPINAILGMDEMILRESKETQTLDYAHNINIAGNTLISLVNDILDFSKIEAGKMDIIPVDYDLSSVLNDLVHMIKPRAEAKNLEVNVDVDSSIPSVLNGDEIRIKQVITNILTNAVKYTEEGSVTLKITWEKVMDDQIDLTVSVRDTGIGIKREDQSRLFSAFQRVDEKRNRNMEGTGLGLNITRQLLNLMRSTLEVESTYGEGSNFFFVLRQRVVKWEPVGDYMEAYERALLARKTYHERFTAPDAEILVVDDTPMNITVFEGLLKKTLVKIDEASGGEECLEKTRLKKYDMIFLDHRMPGMDGIETIERLRAEDGNPNKDTCVISLTANAVSGAREQYIAAGFNDYLTKPIMSDKLETLMQQFLPEEKIKPAHDDDALSKEQGSDGDGGSSDREGSNSGKDDTSGITDSFSGKGDAFASAGNLGELEFLRGVEDVDTAEGLKNCGSLEVYKSAVESYINSARENLGQIEKFWRDGNILDYTIKVHALKSSSRIIGALKLASFAERMEKAGDESDKGTIDNRTQELLEQYRKVFDAIKGKMGAESGEDDQNKPLMDEGSLTEALSSIRELAGSFDYDSIKYIIDNVGGYRVPPGMAELVRNLSDAIRKADWESINNLLK